MRNTDDHGKSTHKPEGARSVTDDGRLLWVGPILPHQQPEFFLDGVKLGNITLEQAMGSYRSAPPSNCSSAQELRSLPDVAALAKEFCRILSETLSAEQVAQVLMRNAEEANPSICHSHDFCDANMVMQAALDSFGVDPMSSGEDGKAMSDEIAVLWADAWDMAKGAGFNASDVARKTAARPS